MRRKADDKAPDDAGEFAQAVVAMFKHITPYDKSDKPFAGNTSADVVRCARGLAFFDRAIREFMQKDGPVATDETAKGVAEASAILDHLISGVAHPIAKHNKGIRSGAFRPQHAPANPIDRLSHMTIVGAALALQHEAQRLGEPITQNEAFRRASDLLSATARPVTSNQVKAWYFKFAEEKDQGPQAVAKEIIKRVALRKSNVSTEAAQMIYGLRGAAEPPV